MEITLEQIQRKFASLPEEIRWAIMAAKVDDKVIEIGQIRGLNVAQMGQLSLEVHMVMLAFTRPENFEESLRGSLKLPDEKIKQIVGDVNERILKGIRQKLMELPVVPNEEDWKPERTAPSPAPVASKPAGNDILKKAGIEIMPEELASGKTGTVAAKLEDSVKMPKVTTEYTLNNLSKAPNTAPEAPKTVPPSSPASSTPDPYRMQVE